MIEFIVGKACRTKVTVFLAKKFRTPKDADSHYNPSATVASTYAGAMDQGQTSDSLTPLQKCMDILSLLDHDQQVTLISELFSSIANTHGSPLNIPTDFLKLVIDATRHLRSCNRLNVLYLMARGLGTMREDNSDSLIPANRMPIEYIAQFFNATSIQQV